MKNKYKYCPNCDYPYTESERKCPVCGKNLQLKYVKTINKNMNLNKNMKVLSSLLLGVIVYKKLRNKKNVKNRKIIN